MSWDGSTEVSPGGLECSTPHIKSLCTYTSSLHPCVFRFSHLWSMLCPSWWRTTESKQCETWFSLDLWSSHMYSVAAKNARFFTFNF